ncbi:MAG: folylpolyglutamate synthase/dihydrofolate synthase family protein [Pseudomonadota bacterium]
MPFSTVSDALAALEGRHPKKIDLSLGRLTNVLERLGDPHRRLPPIVHIAGTNGKGSTAAFVRSILEAAGHSVHVYTSPHLVRFHERIRLAGRLIDDAGLIDVLNAVEEAAGDDPITFFEATTAAAFLAFSQTPADALILEVGLGGRLDATNVIARSALGIIAPISFDHMEFLGNSLPEIAWEKAGIARRGVPLICHQDDASAANTIEKHARDVGAHPVFSGQHYHAQAHDTGIAYSDAKGQIALPLPSLPGAFQTDNAALAVAALRHQVQWPVPEPAFSAGLRWAAWPARLQSLASGTLQEHLPPGSDVVLDGGHNPAAGAQVARFIRDYPGAEGRPIHLVLGMLANKDLHAYLAPFKGLLSGLWGVPVDGHAHHTPADIAACGQELGAPGRAGSGDISAVLGYIADSCGKESSPLVVIVGSLYLAGAVLAANGTLPD